MNIEKIGINSEKYPACLRSIFGAPEELFVKGEILPSDSNAIAIVGTRRPTYYGTAQCEKLSYELALLGITIVSGMARGIDTAAARGAIIAGGRTIAVLGSGHAHIYPRENRKLYGEIAENGAVVSEFPADMRPLRENFPRRNRIISGLAKGVVVVEAARRSGSLITAGFALEQGREVFAMPGNVSSAKSSGTNSLIKQGAKLVENAQDIIEELKYVINIREPVAGVAGAGDGNNAKKPFFTSSEEKAIFGVLSDEPRRLDEISASVKLPSSKVSEALLRLELKKLARALPGDVFVKRR